MATPIGQSSTEVSPGVWEGTTPAGIRRIIGSSYMSTGLLPDSSTERVKGTTGWAYTVPAGAGFARSGGDNQGILIPWEEQTINVAAPSGGAARTDVIYVDSAGVVKVRQGATSPPNTELVIDRMVIPAGAANASSATSNWDITWAIPAGGSLGLLHSYEFPAASHTSSTEKTVYNGRFFVPSDRQVRIDIGITMKSVSALAGSGVIGITIDGTFQRAIHAAYTSQWNTNGATWSWTVPVGAHTFSVWTKNSTGPGFQTAVGATTAEVNITDIGVSR